MGNLMRLIPFRPLKVLLMFLVYGFALACQTTSSSAPSVSIPAPVIGRLTVSTPDENGLTEVTGEVSDADENTIVLVTNTNQAASESALLYFLKWIPEALALNLPEICSLTGRACGRVDSDGIFRIEISASEEDDIEILAIHAQTAAELTEKIKKRVPRNFYHFALPAIDVALVPDKDAAFVVLNNREGSSRIVKLNLVTKTRVDAEYGGKSPVRVILDPTSTRYLVLDNESNALALVDALEENFSSPNVIALPGSPVDAVFDKTGGFAWITLAGRADLAKLDVANVTLSAVTLGESPDGYERVGSNAVTYFHDSGTEKLAVISRFTPEDSDAVTRGITVLDADSGAILHPAESVTGLSSPFSLAFADQDTLLVTDTENSVLGALFFEEDGSFSELVPVTADDTDDLKAPRVVTVAADQGLAFVSANNFAGLHADTVLTVDLTTLEVVDSTPVGFTPLRMVWDPDNLELFVTSVTSRSLTRLSLEQLLPGGTDPF